MKGRGKKVESIRKGEREGDRERVWSIRKTSKMEMENKSECKT